MRHVITLTSIPPRFHAIGPALKALLAQTSRPEAVELYIPRSYRRFPQWSGSLPDVPEGVRIVRVEEDLGPATKILPAARSYRGQDIELLYVDDDRFLERDWAQTSLDLRKRFPGTAICAASFPVSNCGFDWVAPHPLPRSIQRSVDQIHWFNLLTKLREGLLPRYFSGEKLTRWLQIVETSGYTDVAEGLAGVMVRPEFFDDSAFDIPPVLWSVDDVWLSGHLARKGIPIWVEKDLLKASHVGKVTVIFPLYKAVLDGADRKDANRACVDYMRKTYGIWGGTASQAT